MFFFQVFNSPVALKNLKNFGPQEKVEMTPLLPFDEPTNQSLVSRQPSIHLF